MRTILIMILCMACLSASADWRRGLANIAGATKHVHIFPSTDLNMGSDDFSILAWVKPTNNADTKTVIINGKRYAGGKRYHLFVNSDELVSLNIDDNITSVSATSTETVSDGQWHLVVGIRDGNTLRIYIDGIADGTADATAVGNIDDVSDFCYVGIANDSGGSPTETPYAGDLLPPLIYNRALSPAEIAGLYNMNVANTNVGASLEVPRAFINDTNTLVLDLDISEIWDTGATVTNGTLMLNNGSAGGTATTTGTPDVSGAFQVPSPHR